MSLNEVVVLEPSDGWADAVRTLAPRKDRFGPDVVARSGNQPYPF